MYSGQMGQDLLCRAFSSVFNPLFLSYYSIHFISCTNPATYAHTPDQWRYPQSRSDKYHHSSICIRTWFPGSNGTPLTIRRLTSDPHHAHYDTTTLTMIATNAFDKFPQQLTPDLLTTSATNHFNLIITIASTTYNAQTTLPQMPQHFPTSL